MLRWNENGVLLCAEISHTAVLWLEQWAS